MRSIISVFRLSYKKKTKVKKVVLLSILIHHGRKLWYFLQKSWRTQDACAISVLWQARNSVLVLPSLLWVSLHEDLLSPHQDYNPRFPPPLFDIRRSLPPGPSNEPPLSKKYSFLRIVLVSTCRCNMESVGIYRTTERLKRHHHQKKNL